MAYGDPYCGNCHQWMRLISHAHGDTDKHSHNGVWVCDCTVSGQVPDTTKDPNCHNSGHDHHDPESPIVLGQKAMDAAEERVNDDRDTFLLNNFLESRYNVEEEARLRREEADPHVACPMDAVCGQYGDAPCEAEERPFFEVIDELDEILEETNQQVERQENGPGVFYDEAEAEERPRADCLNYGHIWVRLIGTGDPFVFGPVHCLRCNEPAPEEKCLVHSYCVGALFCDKCGQPMDEMQVWPPERKPKPKHKCPGCNLRDLTMEDAKDHIGLLLGVIGLVGVLQSGLPKQLAGKSVQDIRREAAAFLRMSENKIRAMKED